MDFETVQGRKIVPKEIRRVRARKDSLDDHSSDSDSDDFMQPQPRGKKFKNEEQIDFERKKA